ncbi:hypothetical protein, partial [Pseudoclavibacter sp. AY1F1]|uniref:hypothetical protein n=1 Tax=Pseudoclavibacter sp. AY1F1 TaxID=2080583 RepID=UPI001CA5E463
PKREGWTMSHRYESNVRGYLQRATPQEWAVMEDREQTVVELASQIREMVEQTENQLLGQTSSNPDYLQEVGRRNQAKRTAEEIALNQVLYEAYPAKVDPEDDGDEPPEEPPLRPLWEDSRQLPRSLGQVPTPELLARLLQTERKFWGTEQAVIVPPMDLERVPMPPTLLDSSRPAETWAEVEAYFAEQAPIAAFVRSLTWEQWAAIEPVLFWATDSDPDQLDWSELFSAVRQELHRGTLQAALQQ